MYEADLTQIAAHLCRASDFLFSALTCPHDDECHGLRELEESLTLATTLARKAMTDRRIPVKTRRPRTAVAVEVPLPFED